MMPANFSVRRPVATMMCVLTLIVFGVSSIFDMEMESTPEMSMPVFMISTRYEGATPEEVDEMIAGGQGNRFAGSTADFFAQLLKE